MGGVLVLELVHGGDDDGGGFAGGGDIGGLSDALSQPNLFDRLGMQNAMPSAPGTQYFENDHSGPLAGQRISDSFDRSTRVMSTPGPDARDTRQTHPSLGTQME